MCIRDSDYADDSVTHLMALINDAEDDYGNKIGTIETAVSMDEFFPDMYRGGERVWSCFVSADGQVAADDRAASESPWKEAAARMAARTEQPPVSYTHLDVYKRQPWKQSLCSENQAFLKK